jgi:UDPglucose 6-dehydrogenase
MDKIGIVGLGFVGNAIRQSYIDSLVEVVCVDTDLRKSTGTSYNDLKDASGIFICVPSPPDFEGKCDPSILISVLENLKDFNGVIISKVTATPDIYEQLQIQYPNLVHAPEFLTAANAVNDYLTAKFCIIGGSVKAYVNEATRLIKLGNHNLDITYHCTIGEASFAKYVINSFLATKVIFMNEMAELAKVGNHDWDMIRNLIALDGRRIGNSHTQVPGNDKQYGFGGACFPKDTQALIRYAESKKVSLNVLSSAVKKNISLRLTDSK